MLNDCIEKEKCFARFEETKKCTILRDTIFDRPCPFRKEMISYTNGVKYPYDTEYLKHHPNAKP